MRNREDWPDNEMYHTYHADRQKVPPPTKPKPGKPKVSNIFNCRIEQLAIVLKNLPFVNVYFSTISENEHNFLFPSKLLLF